MIIKTVKSFIKKFIFISILFIAFIIYFFNSDLLNNFTLVVDYKNHINSKVSAFYSDKTNFIDSEIRNILGIAKNSQNNDKTINNSINEPITNKETTTTTTTSSSSTTSTSIHVNNKDSTDLNKKFNADLDYLVIPFYYDHSNAPKSLSKDESLKFIQQSSNYWKDACGVYFEYKGDKLADYVSNNNTLSVNTGIIRWTTQLEGNAIGEAHLGSKNGYAKGFVLSLYSDYFVSNKDLLVSTLTHEMGHVIGLDHNENNKSIMFPTAMEKAILTSSDKAMCLYFRYIWSNFSVKEAQDKTGIILN